MKSYLLCAAIGGAAFVFMGLQTGMFGNRGAMRDGDDEEPTEIVESKPELQKKETLPATRFPEDLVSLARAQAVPHTADYKAGSGPHKMAFLKVNGTLHPWQESHLGYNEDWCAERVEEIALAVIVGTQRKTFIQRVTFAQGPPVDRFKWELEASVVEAKTGRVLANRTFVNQPRGIRRLEDYGLTVIGQPVHYRVVFAWVSSQARLGFPEPSNLNPIVTTVGD